MDYQTTLRQAFGEYLRLEPADLPFLLHQFQPRRVAKNEFLLRSGTTCDFWGFVHRGLLRVYAETDQGDEHTGWFVKEQDFVTEHASFYYQRPSLENMVALEDTEVFCLTHPQLQALYQQRPAFERLARRLYERQMADLKQRMLFRVRYGALARYEHLLAHHPALVQRVPLKFLASYLGITSSTLSRIRQRVC